nr:unnamed protein product [Digitaria exilis]
MEGLRLWGRRALAAAASGDRIAAAWAEVRSRAVAPALEAAVWVCLAMSVMLVLEVFYMSVSSFVAVKLLRRVPERRYKWEPMPSGDGDEEAAAEVYPMVLVQIPMYNEIEELVELECKDWARKKINIRYEIRETRKGYKAGALRKGMEHSYAQECDFVAIFDADFQPEPDFLLRTIPFLVHNPKIALVQTRWEFVNYDACLLTRIQKMSLDYHFKVEQESGSSMHAFFGFNGTAGVWRVSAISEAGGWKDRTTVEDMDLAVRASLKGWQFLYIGDIKGVSVWKKFHLLYSFFFVRRVIAPILTFLFYCIVIPLSVMVPEVSIPVWGIFYIPTAITIMTAIRNPWSIHLVPIWILFENVMSMHRMRAAMAGLLETMYVGEWVVTEKVGDHVKDKLEVPLLTPVKPTECVERIYVPELLVALFLLVCASYDLVLGSGRYHLYIFLQASVFLVLGFGFVGTREPCCP